MSDETEKSVRELTASEKDKIDELCDFVGERPEMFCEAGKQLYEEFGPPEWEKRNHRRKTKNDARRKHRDKLQEFLKREDLLKKRDRKPKRPKPILSLYAWTPLDAITKAIVEPLQQYLEGFTMSVMEAMRVAIQTCIVFDRNLTPQRLGWPDSKCLEWGPKDFMEKHDYSRYRRYLMTSTSAFPCGFFHHHTKGEWPELVRKSLKKLQRAIAQVDAQGGDSEEEEVSLEEKALLTLCEHPELSVSQIAKALGSYRTSPYKWKAFMFIFREFKKGNLTYLRMKKNVSPKALIEAFKSSKEPERIDLETLGAEVRLHHVDPKKLDVQTKPDGKVRPRLSPLQYNGDE